MSEPEPPRVRAAGDPVGREVLAALDGLEDRPVAEHVAVLETVDRTIARELAALDEV